MTSGESLQPLRHPHCLAATERLNAGLGVVL
jgi:hypothetical protein